MNSNQKGNSFDKVDRDGVAQHRNIMQELAMKKQITMYQREEKILERELREISKVKETLLQIRTPLRRRVEEAEFEEQNNGGTSEGSFRKATSAVARNSSMTRPANVLYGNPQFVENGGESSINLLKIKPELSTTTEDNSISALSSMEIRGHKTVQIARSRKPPGVGQTKYLAPVFPAVKRPASEGSSKCESLPPINEINPPRATCSPSVRRKSLLMTKPLSAIKYPKKQGESRRVSSSGPYASTLLDSNDVDTSKDHCRAKSVPVARPAASHGLQNQAGPQRRTETDEATTLTIEETLRIKGKFRQIGHSVIATALLKGLRQKKQLSSEAIHNMHKPISLGEETVKNDVNNNTDSGASSKETKQESFDQKNDKRTFKSIAKKAINVNRLLNVSKDRRRLLSDRVGDSVSNSIVTRPSAFAVKEYEQENSIPSPQRKKCWAAKGNGATQRRENQSEFQRNTNKVQDYMEDISTPRSQQFRKQYKDVDPYRPLMNPRTAHARRRRHIFNGPGW